MKKNFIINKFVGHYKKNEIENVKKSFGECGKRVSIEYPCMTVHPELISIGDDTMFLKDCRLAVYKDNAKMEGHIKIGKRCIFNYRESIMAGADLTIGDDVIMASDCCILSENHGMDPESDVPYYDQVLISKPTEIGDGTWLGHGVIVMPGVKIGKKCIIGGGAVVTKDVPDYCIAVGNPAKVIKTYDFEKHSWC